MDARIEIHRDGAGRPAALLQSFGIDRCRVEYLPEYVFGDAPTLADLCLVPQMFNAQRFEIDTARYPTLQRLYEHACGLDAFARAAPGAQPDAE